MKIVDLRVVAFRTPRKPFRNGQILPETTVVQTLTEVITDEGAKGYYLIRLLEKRTPAAEGFEAEKEKIESRLLGQKKRRIYDTWMSELKSRSDIAIDERFLK